MKEALTYIGMAVGIGLMLLLVAAYWWGEWRSDRGSDRAKADEVIQQREEVVTALRLTHEYVGWQMLPPIAGWSWYDMTARGYLGTSGEGGDEDDAASVVSAAMYCSSPHPLNPYSGSYLRRAYQEDPQAVAADETPPQRRRRGVGRAPAQGQGGRRGEGGGHRWLTT